MGVWHEDDAFWEEMGPFMFPQSRYHRQSLLNPHRQSRWINEDLAQSEPAFRTARFRKVF